MRSLFPKRIRSIALGLFFIILYAPEILACVNNITLHEVIITTYPSQITLIRRGVPSTVVKAFYDVALHEFHELKCFCDSNRTIVNSECLGMVFTYEDPRAYHVRRLADHFIVDRKREKEDQFFPLYHENEAHLENLKPTELLEVEKSMNQTFANIQESFSSKESVRIPSSTFPSAELLLHRNKSECENQTSSNITLPATSVIEYALGLAMHVYYATGDTEVSVLLLKLATIIVHEQAICASRSDFRVPVSEIERLVKIAQDSVDNPGTSLLSATALQSFPKLGDVALVVKTPHSYFEGTIRELSSISYLGRFKLVQTNGFGIWMVDVREVLFTVSWESYSRRLFYHRTILGERDTTGTSGSEHDDVVCDEGYIYQNRVHIGDILENCCASACARIDGVLFGASISREACCDACNMVQCGNLDAARNFSEDGMAYGFETVIV